MISEQQERYHLLKGCPMAQKADIRNVVESSRQEMVFAIKQRIGEITGGCSAPVCLDGVIIQDSVSRGKEPLRYFEVNNLYVDEADSLRGDLISRDDRCGDGVLFGKTIDDLSIDGMKLILNALYSEAWSVDLADYESCMPDKKEGIQGFLSGKYASISRIIRKGA
jgi:hypothetical protein